MYEYIKGAIAELTPEHCVLECYGIGYNILISLNTYSAINTQKETKLYIHFTVRDDARIFFGFADRKEREVFRLLISVSGVGGNTARMILSTFTTEELSKIISSENAAVLKSVKGLGIKTAQKIIVELKDKIIAFSSGSGALQETGGMPGNGNFDEALAALVMLGFPRNISEKALRNVVKENPDSPVEDLVRIALKTL